MSNLHIPKQRVNYFKYLKRKAFQSTFSPYYFAYGRTALKYGIQALDLHLDKRAVLLPAFICVEAVKPFTDLGLQILYYQIKDDFSPNWEDINIQVKKGVSAIVMLHYYGLAQDIEKFVAFAKLHGLALIEDNTHGFGGFYNGQMLGEFGDMGIASPRKTFPLNNGALLYLKHQKIEPPHLPLEPMPVYALLIKAIVAKAIELTLPLPLELFVKQLFHGSKGQSAAAEEAAVLDWSTDSRNVHFLNNVDLVAARKIRCDLYNVWYRWCRLNGIEAIALQSYDCAPMSFPVVLPNKKMRDALFDFFNTKNIPVFIEWSFQSPLNDFESAFRDRMLCLPINMDYSPRRLERFLRRCGQFAFTDY